MPDVTIPDAAVEAAARAAYEEGFLRHVRRTRFGFTWDEISDEARESWRQVVIAAAPHIAAQALRDAAEAIHPFRPVGGHTPVTRDGLYDWLRDRADQIEDNHG